MSAPESPAACIEALRGADAASRPWITTADREVTYAMLLDRIGRVAALVRRRGLSIGDRVVVATADDCEAALLFVALVCNGITAVQLDPLIGTERAQSLTRKANPSLVIVDAALNARWALGDLGEVLEIAAPTAKGGLFGGLMRVKPSSGLHAELASLTPEEPPEAIPSETLAYILFTSGTTKEPKGVCISHRALFGHLATLSRVFGYSAESRILNTLMLSHADGMIQGPVIAFFNAASLYRPVKFEITTLERLLDSVFQLRITHMVAVPTMLALMARLNDHQNDAFKGGDFRLLVSCGAALEPALWEDFERKFSVDLINVYGLTETVVGGVFAGPGTPPEALGSIGLPIDCALKILDDGSGQGELLMQGDLVMSGYFDDPGQTAEVMRDGWFHTGDIARVDCKGRYWICGRKKNIVIRGGLNIHPEEISEALNRHPLVDEAVAFGMPDADWGERLVAVVASGSASESDLLEYCAGVLEPRKIPSAIKVVATLPKGRSGKVVMEEARALFAQAAATPFAASGSADAEGRLLDVAARIFKAERSQVKLTSTPNDIPGWDSLAHIEFVTAVEGEFGIRLAPREIMALTRVGKALDFVP